MITFIFLLVIAYILTYSFRWMTDILWGQFIVTASVKGLKSMDPYYENNAPFKYRVFGNWIFYLLGVRYDPKKVIIGKNPGRRDVVIKKDLSFDYYWFVIFVFLFFNLCLFYIYLISLGVNPNFGIALYSLFCVITFNTDDGGTRFFESIFLSSFLLLLLNGCTNIYIYGFLVLFGAMNKETSILMIPIYFIYTVSYFDSIMLFSLFLVGSYFPIKIYGAENKERLKIFIDVKRRFKSYISMYKGFYDGWGFYFRETFLNANNFGLLILLLNFVLAFYGWDLFDKQFNYLIVLFCSFAILINIPANLYETRVFMPLSYIVVPIATKLLS